MELKRGRVPDPTDRSRRRDPLLHARPRRLHDRGRPVHRAARRQARKEAPRGSARVARVYARVIAGGADRLGATIAEGLNVAIADLACLATQAEELPAWARS